MHERTTKAICNKGFTGNSSILPRKKIRVGGQESSPQSLTAYSLNRYAAGRKNSKQTVDNFKRDFKPNQLIRKFAAD
jgi:hypothetical protein